jgi:hypothetical protein
MENEEILASFTPKDKNYEGEIKISLPDYEQTMRYTDSMGLIIGENGEVSFKSSEVGAMAEMAKNVKKHIKQVDLKHKKTGAEIKTFNQLSVFCKPIMSELIGLFVKGFEPGKNLKLL